MHIPDGMLNNPTSIALGAAAIAALVRSVQKVRSRVLATQLSLANGMGTVSSGFSRVLSNKMMVLAGLIFALQMVNYPIQDGTSGHFMGAALATALVGPYAAIIVMAVVVVVQAIFFADGGLFVLGVNIVNMGVIPVVVTWLFLRGSSCTTYKKSYLIKLGLAAWFSIVMASAAAALEIALSQQVALPRVLAAMVETHALIGIGEAVLTLLFFWLMQSFFPQTGEENE